MNTNFTQLTQMKEKYVEALETSCVDVYVDNCLYQYFSTFLYSLETEIAYISYYPRRYVTSKRDLTYVVQCISYIVDIIENTSHNYEDMLEAFINLDPYYDLTCFPELCEIIKIFTDTNSTMQEMAC